MLALLATTLLGQLRGPIAAVLERLIPDADLRARMEGEIAAALAGEAEALVKAQEGVILAEVAGGWMTRNWRPALMFFIIFLLFVHGLALPLAGLWAGHAIAFHPAWAEIPDPLWQLLQIGLGGYIGGRSLEKIAAGWPRGG